MKAGEEQVLARAGKDLDLVQAAAAGEPRARRELVRRLLERTRTTVRYLAGNHPDADDLVQICLVEVLRSAGSFRGESRIESWAERIVVRTALRKIKSERKRAAAVRELPAPEESSGDTLEDSVHRAQVRQRLAEILQKLSPERRVTLTLALVHDLRIAEIAEITGAPINTVRDRLRTGRKQLRELIARDPALRGWARTRRS